MISHGPIALCVLDGWGVGDDNDHNAIKNANPNCFNFLNKEFPSTTLIASGTHVGLPKEQMGNSEVGHMTMGSGRVILQDLVKINSHLNTVLQQEKIKNLIANLRKSKKRCHLIGLASDGGVHSHINHLMTIAKYLISEQIAVDLHLIMDGRDSAPTSGIGFVKLLNEAAQADSLLSISSISGRYFAMDRDQNFDRTKKAVQAILSGDAEVFNCPEKAILSSYEKDVTDEFIEPQRRVNYKGIEDGDAIIFCNFRADRMRQLCNAFLDPSFTGFKRNKIVQFSKAITMTSYSQELEKFAHILFQRESHKNILSEILNSHGLSSLRIAETEKYAHVTFFFDVGKEYGYANEKSILVPSPKVATYNHKPEMSAGEITNTLLLELEKNKYNFVLLNYANLDMVGHTGDYLATVQAVKTVDVCLQKLYNAVVKKMNGTLVIVGDHGNAECMVEKESGKVRTAHTTNPVPFIIANRVLKNNQKVNLQTGSLVDVAPTLLGLFGIQRPKEMSGKNLLKYEKNYAGV